MAIKFVVSIVTFGTSMNFMCICHSRVKNRGGFRGRGVTGVAYHPPLEKQNIQNLKMVVNIIAEIKANSLDRLLIFIFSLWHC